MPFTIPHDAADPVGFTFRTEGTKLAVATDLVICRLMFAIICVAAMCCYGIESRCRNAAGGALIPGR